VGPRELMVSSGGALVSSAAASGGQTRFGLREGLPARVEDSPSRSGQGLGPERQPGSNESRRDSNGEMSGDKRPSWSRREHVPVATWNPPVRFSWCGARLEGEGSRPAIEIREGGQVSGRREGPPS
jgi:hypothetical protein